MGRIFFSVGWSGLFDAWWVRAAEKLAPFLAGGTKAGQTFAQSPRQSTEISCRKLFWRVERLMCPGMSSILFYLPGGQVSYWNMILMSTSARAELVVSRGKSLTSLGSKHWLVTILIYVQFGIQKGLQLEGWQENQEEREGPCGINMSLNSNTAPGDSRMGWHNCTGPKSALTNAHWMVNYNRNSVNVWESHMNIKQIHYDQCYYSEYQMSS